MFACLGRERGPRTHGTTWYHLSRITVLSISFPNAGGGWIKQLAYWRVARPYGGGDAVGEAELYRELPACGNRALPSVGDSAAAGRVERHLLG